MNLQDTNRGAILTKLALNNSSMRALALSLLLALTTHAQTRVLFIGNSYTAANSLPSMVENVASSAGHSFANGALTPGGATLYQHSQNAATYAAMAGQSWDYIVFQAQSQEPAFPWGQVNFQTLPFADILVDSARSIAPCAQPTFFRTWGRKNGDSGNCSVWPPVCTYEGMDSLLHLRYRMMADSNEAYLSPVGSVWHYLRDTDTTIELYDTDGSHPSLAGTYAAACTFFTIFTREDPMSITSDENLDPTVASTIRMATKLVVYDSLSSWNVGNYDPVASLAYSVSRDTLTFNSTSTYTDSVYIDFGDGNGTSDPFGQHSYGLDDFFTVTLYAFRCDRSDTLEVQVQSIIIFGMDEPALEPLPSLESLAQEWPENLQRVELFNLQGQLLWTGTKQQRGPLPRNDHQTWVLRYNYENGTYRSAVGSK